MAPHILVTNDDGIDAPGIRALADALRALGRVTVVAPDRNWSISGHQKSLDRFLRADPVDFHGLADVRAFATSAAPADCVAMAYLGLLDERPDLVVSGINRGPNLGQDITYSGTVSAAFETAIFGHPSIAISLDNRDPDADYDDAAWVGVRIARAVLEKGLPRHTLLNVNVPALPADRWTGLKVVRLGIRDYDDRLVRGEDPSGRPYYWITGDDPGGDTETPDTDVWAIHHGYVAITPVRLDMTDPDLMQRVGGWFDG